MVVSRRTGPGAFVLERSRVPLPAGRESVQGMVSRWSGAVPAQAGRERPHGTVSNWFEKLLSQLNGGGVLRE